jgi:hypothetical protein
MYILDVNENDSTCDSFFYDLCTYTSANLPRLRHSNFLCMYIYTCSGNWAWDKRLPIRKKPGANPMALSYNASAVKIYNAMNSIARF